jgi:hypothetical protein
MAEVSSSTGPWIPIFERLNRVLSEHVSIQVLAAGRFVQVGVHVSRVDLESLA